MNDHGFCGNSRRTLRLSKLDTQASTNDNNTQVFIIITNWWNVTRHSVGQQSKKFQRSIENNTFETMSFFIPAQHENHLANTSLGIFIIIFSAVHMLIDALLKRVCVHHDKLMARSQRIAKLLEAFSEGSDRLASHGSKGINQSPHRGGFEKVSDRSY